MIRFTEDGKVDRRWSAESNIPVANSYTDLADALDIAVAALRIADQLGGLSPATIRKRCEDVAFVYYKTHEALLHIGAEHD